MRESLGSTKPKGEMKVKAGFGWLRGDGLVRLKPETRNPGASRSR